MERKDKSYLWKHVKKLESQISQNNMQDELIIDGKLINSPKRNNIMIKRILCQNK